jgi:hypothetical protein
MSEKPERSGTEAGEIRKRLNRQYGGIKIEAQARLELINEIIPKLEKLETLRLNQNPDLRSLREELSLINELIPLYERLEELKQQDRPL